MHTFIVANAPGFDAAPFAAVLARAALVIAADGGANALYRANCAPHVVIGDLDSLESAALTWLETRQTEIIRYPAAKDETDLELALLLAVERGASQIDLLGALGGRLDHTFANLTMLTMGQLRGLRVRMLAPDHEVSIVQAGTPQTVEGRPGEVVSLLPLAPAASGITLEGFAYPLEDGTLYAARARGVSNELRAPRGHIQLTEGTLLVVHYVTADDDSAAGEEPRT